MGAGIIRQGAARRHFDDARPDVGLDALGHIGFVLVWNASQEAVQRVHNCRSTPNETGNYNLPNGNVEFVDCPSPTGSLCLLGAQLDHEVLDSADRLTLAGHIAPLANGNWVVYA
tara:strand:+ start:5664 stop:6008 length:345 start_codon:yes stop_codon:yes gene_type:complete